MPQMEKPGGDTPQDTNKTTYEEQLHAITVGKIEPLSKPIQIVDYDPEWPGLFEREAERVRPHLVSEF